VATLWTPAALTRFPGPAQHLRVPHDRGLLTRTRQGREVLCTRTPLADTRTGGPPPH
jgi:hypothetical protein